MSVSAGDLAFALSAGLIASLNPCAFAMLPAFAGYYIGLDEDGASARGPLRRVGRGIAVGAAMTVGFVVVFASIGALVSLAGSGLLRFQDIVGTTVAIALVGLGVWLAAGRELSLLIPNPAGRRGRGNRDLMSAGIYGIGFGFASLACTLPIFLIVVGTAFVSGSVLGGLSLFLAYSIGMGAIVMAVSVSAAVFKGALLRFLRRAMPFVQQASGVLLILAGTYLATRQLDQAKLGTLAPLQPYATEIGAGLVLAAVVATAAIWWMADDSEGEDLDLLPVEQSASRDRVFSRS